MNEQLPSFMTEEEAERKAAMIKSASEVADSVNEMKLQLEKLGWNMAEQAALTLFNTLLMTAFSKEMEMKQSDKEQKFKTIEEALTARIGEILREKGFDGEATNQTCIKMWLDKKPENLIGSIWEDYYGEGSQGVFFSATIRAKREITEEFAAREGN